MSPAAVVEREWRRYTPRQRFARFALYFGIVAACVVSLRTVHRDIDLQFFNSMLRSLGLPQSAPGKRPVWDAIKLAFYRSGLAVVRPLRSSEALRRILRRIALGKNANYYLKRA
mgnify:CR=1 FL=1